MNQQVTSQQHHMTTSSSGGSQTVKQTYNVQQQQQQSFQHHYSSQPQVRMQQQYQVHQQSSHQGGFGQPGQTQTIVQDSSSMKSHEFAPTRQSFQRGPAQQFQPQNQTFMSQPPDSQQNFQRGPQQQYQPQNQAFMNQSPVNQQFQRPSAQSQGFPNQSFQPNNLQSFPNQTQPLSQQQCQNIPQQQVEQPAQPQAEDEYIRKPTKKLIQQWPPQQILEETPKPQFEPVGQGLTSWPPRQDSNDENQGHFDPNPLGQQNVGKYSKMFQPQQPIRNGHQPEPQSPQQVQAVPQPIPGQKQKGTGAPQGVGGPPAAGVGGQGPKVPQGIQVLPGGNIPKGTGIGQAAIPPQQRVPSQLPNTSHGPGFRAGTTPSQGKGLGQVSHPPQGPGYDQGINNPQGAVVYGQGPNNPQRAGYGQGQNPTAIPQGPEKQIVPQPQEQDGLQKYEPLALPRGNIHDQKALFEKPHSYDPLQCDIGRPYGDGDLPEWPPKNAGGPNMTMTYPSAFKLRDEAPIDHQTLPLSAPSQPAFKLTTPIRKKGDECWPPKGGSSDEPDTEVREFSRPTKANKTYDSFFASNMLPNNYPGYRAPPGTQHVGYMDDAQPL